jgi:hypothetical protein
MISMPCGFDGVIGDESFSRERDCALTHGPFTNAGVLMTTPSNPSFTVGQIRLTLSKCKRGSARPTVSVERQFGNKDTDWSPAATFLLHELPMLAEAVRRMREHLEGPPPKASGPKPAQAGAAATAAPTPASSPTSQTTTKRPPFEEQSSRPQVLSHGQAKPPAIRPPHPKRKAKAKADVKQKALSRHRTR